MSDMDPNRLKPRVGYLCYLFYLLQALEKDKFQAHSCVDRIQFYVFVGLGLFPCC